MTNYFTTSANGIFITGKIIYTKCIFLQMFYTCYKEREKDQGKKRKKKIKDKWKDDQAQGR